jgi:hypothetical protein
VLGKELTNNGPLIPSAAKHSISTGNARDPIPCYWWPKTDPKAGRLTTAIVTRDVCPKCGSNRYKKNGHIRHGKQHNQCKACDRQFVTTAENPIIADEQAR